MENCIVNSVEVEVEKPWLTKKNLKEQKKKVSSCCPWPDNHAGYIGTPFLFP